MAGISLIISSSKYIPKFVHSHHLLCPNVTCPLINYLTALLLSLFSYPSTTSKANHLEYSVIQPSSSRDQGKDRIKPLPTRSGGLYPHFPIVEDQVPRNSVVAYCQALEQQQHVHRERCRLVKHSSSTRPRMP